MTERLDVTFTPGEGAVLRILGLVERRGFQVRGIAMREALPGAALAIDIDPRDASRNVQVVARQLERLIDVRSVAVSTASSGPST